jgi:hypothetical protein
LQRAAGKPIECAYKLINRTGQMHGEQHMPGSGLAPERDGHVKERRAQ